MAAFLPTSVSGCVLWLDGADSSTLTQSAGKVSQWNDKSSNAYNATQATGTAQPGLTTIGGLQALSFAGAAFMSNASATMGGGENRTIFIVCQRNDTTTNYELIYQEQPISTSLGVGFYGVGSRVYIGVSNTLATTNSLGQSVPGVVEVTWQNASSYAIYFNDTSEASGSTAASASGTSGYCVGSQTTAGAYLLIGAIGEIVIYSSVLSTANRQQVAAYLAWKWGQQSKLDASSPYRNALQVSTSSTLSARLVLSGKTLYKTATSLSARLVLSGKTLYKTATSLSSAAAIYGSLRSISTTNLISLSRLVGASVSKATTAATSRVVLQGSALSTASTILVPRISLLTKFISHAATVITGTCSLTALAVTAAAITIVGSGLSSLVAAITSLGAIAVSWVRSLFYPVTRGGADIQVEKTQELFFNVTNR